MNFSWCKVNLNFAKSQKKYSLINFNVGINDQKSLLEESNPFQVILDLEACYDHLVGIESWSINFLHPNIGFSYSEA